MAPLSLRLGKHVREDIEKFYERPVTRVSLELTLSLITVLFFAVFALRPTINTMSKLLKDIEDRRVIEEGLTKKMAALSTAQGEILTYGNRIQVFQTAVPTDLSSQEVLFILEYLALQQQVGIQNLRVGEEPVPFVVDGKRVGAEQIGTSTPANYSLVSYDVRMTLNTDLAGAQKFFAAVESIRPLMIVRGFSLTVAETRDRERRLNVTATISVPFYTSSKKAAAETKASSGSISQRAAAGEDVGGERVEP